MKADSLVGILILVFAAAGCGKKKAIKNLEGEWLFKFELQAETLPFTAQIVQDEGAGPQFYAINGEERIRADQFEVHDDSVFIRLPIFNTALIGKITNSGMEGDFHDYSRKGDYRIPFTAKKSFKTRFDLADRPTADANGKWRIAFSPESDNQYMAIGQFEQHGNKATGTFLTTTGDYRYLEGNVSGDSLFLSCFDGAHVFLFKARIDESKIVGDFWSGTHWQENWIGERDTAFELPSPNELTFLKPGSDKLEFGFSNLDGEQINLSDETYSNKVVIVQLMGSWCPNCMDETAYLVELFNEFHPQGLEVIGLAFEKSDNQETNIRSLKRLRDHFNVPYEILLAGHASKKEAAEKLPMLNHVISFPTTIFIDRKGEVRRIHTGFSGPGTGEYYREFVEETDKFVTQLLIE